MSQICSSFDMGRSEEGIFIQISDDSLNMPSLSDAAYVREYLKSQFPAGIETSHGVIYMNKRGRGEFTNGSYTKMLQRENFGLFLVKMNLSPAIPAILEIAQLISVEPPSHERGDVITAFKRSKAFVKVNGQMFSFDVLTALYPDGREVFYDINNIKNMRDSI